jgi:hypothetical protein
VTAKQAELDELLAEQAATADKIYNLVKTKL